MRPFLRNGLILALALTAFVAARSRAVENTDRLEVVSLLADEIQTALAGEEKPHAWIKALGERKSYPISAADSENLTVLIENNPYPVRWTDISIEELAGVARSLADGRGERLVVAAEIALALHLPDHALDSLIQIRDPDDSLKQKIYSVSQRISALKPSVPLPPKPALKPPQKPESKAPVAAHPESKSLLPVIDTPISGPVINVGPTRACKTVASGLARAKAGDTVLVDLGTYNEVCHMRNKGTPSAPVTLRGVRGPNGERPVLDATGLTVSGASPSPRAIIQVEGEHCIVDGLEMKNARNGNNGSGLRFIHCHNTIVRNCKITYCDMGLMGGDDETLLIERCEVAYNGTKDFNGYSHNFYLMGNRAIIRECYIHNSLFGQNFKTRGHYTELWYNFICDSEEGELGFVDEKETALANSNALLVGNVIISKPDRKGNAVKYIEFGGEGALRDGNLYLFNNTLIAGSPRILFIRLSEPQSKLVASNNIFVGSPHIAVRLPSKQNANKPVTGSFSGANNCCTGAPPGFTNNLSASASMFISAATRDYHLQSACSAANAGAPVDALVYVDGDAKSHKAVPSLQLIFPMSSEARPKKAGLDVGAFGLP